MDNFTKIELNNRNLDTYCIRNAIFNALKSNINLFSGHILDIGCGKKPYEKFILENSQVLNYTGLDIENALIYDNLVKPDYTWDGVVMPFDNNSFECAFGTEVLEHCPEPEIVLKEVFRVLKPNGVFFFTVPFLWNLHEVPHDEYRYTPFSLERHLKKAGFTNIQIKATGGWHASMAQMLGLWVKRSSLSKNKRKIATLLIKPLIKILLKKDKPDQVKFNEGQMITGLYGTARK
jgi:SAM-dependent methyltransferase